jgi:hypothetical protein
MLKSVETLLGEWRRFWRRPSPPSAELIKLIVQVLDDVLHLNRGELLVCHMTAVGQLPFQRI